MIMFYYMCYSAAPFPEPPQVQVVYGREERPFMSVLSPSLASNVAHPELLMRCCAIANNEDSFEQKGRDLCNLFQSLSRQRGFSRSASPAGLSTSIVFPSESKDFVMQTKELENDILVSMPSQQRDVLERLGIVKKTVNERGIELFEVSKDPNKDPYQECLSMCKTFGQYDRYQTISSVLETVLPLLGSFSLLFMTLPGWVNVTELAYVNIINLCLIGAGCTLCSTYTDMKTDDLDALDRGIKDVCAASAFICFRLSGSSFSYMSKGNSFKTCAQLKEFIDHYGAQTVFKFLGNNTLVIRGDIVEFNRKKAMEKIEALREKSSQYQENRNDARRKRKFFYRALPTFLALIANGMRFWSNYDKNQAISIIGACISGVVLILVLIDTFLVRVYQLYAYFRSVVLNDRKACMVLDLNILSLNEMLNNTDSGGASEERDGDRRHMRRDRYPFSSSSADESSLSKENNDKDRR